jgi:hypothetical protein
MRLEQSSDLRRTLTENINVDKVEMAGRYFTKSYFAGGAVEDRLTGVCRLLWNSVSS